VCPFYCSPSAFTFGSYISPCSESVLLYYISPYILIANFYYIGPYSPSVWTHTYSLQFLLQSAEIHWLNVIGHLYMSGLTVLSVGYDWTMSCLSLPEFQLNASYNMIYNFKNYLQASLGVKNNEVGGQPTSLSHTSNEATCGVGKHLQCVSCLQWGYGSDQQERLKTWDLDMRPQYSRWDPYWTPKWPKWLTDC